MNNSISHSCVHPKKGPDEDDSFSFSNAKYLYEQVMRKTHESIKLILKKVNEVTTKQEEFQSSLNFINQKISEITENNQNIHHEVRANFFEIQKKQQIIINDIKGVKCILKIPDPQTPHEDYLSSRFFQEQSVLINNRSRSRAKSRHRTHFEDKEEQQQTENNEKKHATLKCNSHRGILNDDIPQIKRKTTINCEISDQAQQDFLINIPSERTQGKIRSGKTLIEPEQIEGMVKIQVREMNDQLVERLSTLNNLTTEKTTEVNQKLSDLKEHVETRLQIISKQFTKQIDWNQIDFDQLHNYLEGRVKEHLNDYVTSSFFQESLFNLKQTWQIQLFQIYAAINQKLAKEDLTVYNERLNDISSQLENYTHLNSIKIQNISYNSTCKSTPFRVNLDRSSVVDPDSNRGTKESDESKVTRKNKLKYSNSMSRISKVEERKGNWDKLMGREKEDFTEQQWKDKAIETLGLANKMVRKQRRRE